MIFFLDPHERCCDVGTVHLISQLLDSCGGCGGTTAVVGYCSLVAGQEAEASSSEREEVMSMVLSTQI